MRFMRGKYKLDELPGQSFGFDCLKFRQGKKTILIIQIHEDHYVFQIIHGKAEREKFESRRGEFPQAIQDIYDAGLIFDGGKWLFIPVFNLETLEAVKKLILMKKNPNRKPFPVTNIHRGSCGHRCDLCVHYKGETSFSSEEMDYARECCTEVYGVGDFGNKFCGGCHFPDCDVGSAICRKAKGTEKCWDCKNYTACLKTAGYPPEIHTRTITADQVTYAILPYVKGQYGN